MVWKEQNFSPAVHSIELRNYSSQKQITKSTKNKLKNVGFSFSGRFSGDEAIRIAR